jgi:ABC-2 type transport system permease protein
VGRKRISGFWIKLRTLRSTWWAMGIGVIVALALTTCAHHARRLHRHLALGSRPHARPGRHGHRGGRVRGRDPGSTPARDAGHDDDHGRARVSHDRHDLPRHAVHVQSLVLLAKASVLSGAAIAVSLLIAIPGYLYGRLVAFIPLTALRDSRPESTS